jgi:hypothetical protein
MVVALVDSGASASAIGRSLAKKLNKCVGPSVRFRGWDSKTVAIDSFVNMEVTWKGRKTEVKRVASVKHPPFFLILGADWIVVSGQQNRFDCDRRKNCTGSATNRRG